MFKTVQDLFIQTELLTTRAGLSTAILRNNSLRYEITLKKDQPLDQSPLVLPLKVTDDSPIRMLRGWSSYLGRIENRVYDRRLKLEISEAHLRLRKYIKKVARSSDTHH